MRRAITMLTVLACCSCHRRPEQTTVSATASPSAAIVNHVWVRSDSTGLPGVTRVFLSDGTLVMDSCWETFQLVKWHAESDSVVVWREGTAEVRATILEPIGETLALRLDLPDGKQEQHYRLAPVPYVCPDMPR
jgi:hypothetical protein